MLKSIYGKMIFSIGVFSPLEARRENLSKINRLSVEDIAELINTDSGEEFDHGQSVRDTFPKCDYFCGLTVGWQSQEMPMLKAKFYLNWNVSLS